MESTAIMGEADETICKDKSNDMVNGNASCDEEEMEVDGEEISSKAPIKKSLDSIENHNKVPDEKVPNMDNEENGDGEDEDDEDQNEVDEEDADNNADEQEDAEEESMDVDDQNEEEDVVSQDDDKSQDSQERSELDDTTNDKNEEDDDQEEIDDDEAEETEARQNGTELTNGTGTENSLNDSDMNEDSKMDSSVELVDKKDKNKSELDTSDVVVIEGDNETKENGEKCIDINDSTEIINLSDKEQESNKETPSPSKKKAKKPPVESSGPPRRSTRNLNKNRSYIEEKVEEEEDPDIEEVVEVDPLADPLRDDKENTAKTPTKKKPNQQSGSSTIVVSDTKRLVEIAANQKQANSTGKKEPTLVIIDTNSILSGRGPVPVTPKPASAISTSFSMMPVALPAQGVYPPNMRATITPIPMQKQQQAAQMQNNPPAATQQPAPILPSLTDDMFVVEAPSFIVPYVYEKPPTKPFKEFISQIAKEIEEAKKKADEEAKQKKESEKKDHAEEDSSDEGDEDSKDKSDDDNKDKEKEEKDKEEKDKKEEQDKKEDKDVEIVEKKDEIKTIDLDEISDEKKSTSYFDGPLGSFFINIGFGLVQEYVQTDLLKQQKRKNNREGNTSIDTKMAINSLMKNLEYSKENNEPFRLQQRKCEFCSFKTESNLVLAHHLETPHMRNYVYKCNFCPLEVRSPHDILFHMEAEHNIRGRLERAPAFHQCPNCPFEDNQKGKLSRHLINCLKKFKPEKNLDPPQDWEPPAKIPRIPRVKQTGIAATAATYQALAKQQQNNSYQLYKKLQNQTAAQQALFNRGRGRPTLGMGTVNPIRPQQPIIRTNMMYRPGTSGGSVLVPTSYQFSGNQVFQNSTNKTNSGKSVQQPSISITPLPRQPTGTTITKTASPANANSDSSKPTFVICEICDGYIKDLEQLRNHMQWIHKVKIHPKMIYNRPPLNCQKCQFRFFTDQGLERHLLGSHGLVTSSMQEAANKSKDAGRCPVCGRVYQWKLLNHVARDHNMTLKPAHLSYKCTVCTATFGMYKQFENHVYSAHSVVAKRVMEKKASSPTTNPKSTTNDSLLKPLKINDEITIIPQPAKAKNNSATNSRTSTSNDRGK